MSDGLIRGQEKSCDIMWTTQYWRKAGPNRDWTKRLICWMCRRLEYVLASDASRPDLGETGPRAFTLLRPGRHDVEKRDTSDHGA